VNHSVTDKRDHNGGSDFMDPNVIMAIQSLELRARLVVDGFRNGMNRSSRHGFSVEFSEYRSYSPGDDPRFIDWKLAARTDRHYIRRYEDETNLRCMIVLDCSRSMQFGSLSYTKSEYARTMAAAISWLLQSQGDAVGITLFDEEVRQTVAPRFRPGQLRRILIALEQAAGGTDTQPAVALERTAQLLRRRSLVILISDLLSPADGLASGLRSLRGSGHETLILQILDPAELSLSFSEAFEFADLETGRQVHCDPELVRSRYQQRMANHQNAIIRECDSLGIPIQTCTTDTPAEKTLSDLLQLRRHRRHERSRGNA
jgi:uncharacterized protein (DUF58 family)